MEISEKLYSRFLSRVNKISINGCWDWTGALFSDGYGGFWDTTKTRKAHRWSWEYHNRKIIPSGMLVLHICDNRKCVNPDHLWVGTHDDNMKDMSKKGRASRKGIPRYGEDNPNSKLTNEQIQEILVKWNGRLESQRSMARRMGVHYDTINRIIMGTSWKRFAR